MCLVGIKQRIITHSTSYSSRMSSLTTKSVDYATLPKGVPSKLPMSVKNLNKERYLTDFGNEIHFTDGEVVDDTRKLRRITFNHAATMKNVTDNMEKYGLRLEIDGANLPVVIQTTVRPPFETLVALRSPAGVIQNFQSATPLFLFVYLLSIFCTHRTLAFILYCCKF